MHLHNIYKLAIKIDLNLKGEKKKTKVFMLQIAFSIQMLRHYSPGELTYSVSQHLILLFKVKKTTKKTSRA